MEILLIFCWKIRGEGGIRTPVPSKSGNDFRGRRIRPLCHLSKKQANLIYLDKFYQEKIR